MGIGLAAVVERNIVRVGDPSTAIHLSGACEPSEPIGVVERLVPSGLAVSHPAEVIGAAPVAHLTGGILVYLHVIPSCSSPSGGPR